MVPIVVISIIIAFLLMIGLLSFDRREPKSGSSIAWSFFLILFFAIWAANLWVYPSGPLLWGVAWIPLLFFGFLITLIIATISSFYRVGKSATVGENNPEIPSGQPVKVTVGVFFWILLIFFIFLIVLGYTR